MRKRNEGRREGELESGIDLIVGGRVPMMRA